MEEPISSLDNLPISFGPQVLAAVLGISKSRAYTLANQKEFPKLRVGRRIVIMREQFLLWLAAQTKSRKN